MRGEREIHYPYRTLAEAEGHVEQQSWAGELNALRASIMIISLIISLIISVTGRTALLGMFAFVVTPLQFASEVLYQFVCGFSELFQFGF